MQKTKCDKTVFPYYLILCRYTIFSLKCMCSTFELFCQLPFIHETSPLSVYYMLICVVRLYACVTALWCMWHEPYVRRASIKFLLMCKRRRHCSMCVHVTYNWVFSHSLLFESIFKTKTKQILCENINNSRWLTREELWKIRDWWKFHPWYCECSRGKKHTYKMTATDQMRAMLDQLMGTTRNGEFCIYFQYDGMEIGNVCDVFELHFWVSRYWCSLI